MIDTTLIRRLRTYGGGSARLEAADALEQQAEQIEALRADVERLRGACQNARDIIATDRQSFVDCQRLRDTRTESPIEHGLVWVDEDTWVTPDQILELCEALETRRILNEIKKVATLHPADDMPTPFQSAWQTCCEEIFYRATGEQWHMDEDARKFARAANDSDIDAALRQEQPNE